MKKIGILGGLGPEATVEYYRIITTLCRQRGMGHNYPEIIIYSVNLQEFLNLVESGNLKKVQSFLSNSINSLYKAGAEFALMAAGTPHIVYNELVARSPIPLLSIVEETGKVARKSGFTKVGLFGTKFTMRANFYGSVLSGKYGVSVVIPEEAAQGYIHSKILTELANGQIVEETRQQLVKLTRAMAAKEGAEAIILGCTELPLILSEEVIGIPVLDTTRIHAEAALDFSMQ